MLEKKIVFRFTDIKAVRVRCFKCPGEVLVPLEGKASTTPRQCPLCNEDWAWNGVPDEIQFLQELRRLARAEEGKPHVRLRFEIDAPELLDQNHQ